MDLGALALVQCTCSKSSWNTSVQNFLSIRMQWEEIFDLGHLAHVVDPCFPMWHNNSLWSGWANQLRQQILKVTKQIRDKKGTFCFWCSRLPLAQFCKPKQKLMSVFQKVRLVSFHLFHQSYPWPKDRCKVVPEKSFKKIHLPTGSLDLTNFGCSLSPSFSKQLLQLCWSWYWHLMLIPIKKGTQFFIANEQPVYKYSYPIVSATNDSKCEKEKDDRPTLAPSHQVHIGLFPSLWYPSNTYRRKRKSCTYYCVKCF